MSASTMIGVIGLMGITAIFAVMLILAGFPVRLTLAFVAAGALLAIILGACNGI